MFLEASANLEAALDLFVNAGMTLSVEPMKDATGREISSIALRERR